jgi:putative ABC transport system substrate-binding protein
VTCSSWLRSLIAIALATVATAVAAQQSGKVPTVGVLMLASGPHDTVVEAFRHGLRELGYVEGRNIRIEHRSALGNIELLPQLAEELVGLRVDVIVVGAVAPARAARQASNTVPIVVAFNDYDPVATGLVESFSRPGGNLTGVFARQSELAGKRIELLRELLPRMSRVAVLWDGSSSEGSRGEVSRIQREELEPAARSAGLNLQLIEVRAPYDFQAAFKAAKTKKAGAVMVLFSPVFWSSPWRARLAQAALAARLPTIFQDPDNVEAGGLISYGIDVAHTWGRAAYFVDRVLKGTKPQDLPVEQVSNFKLVINLKTAKALGLTIPESILLRADELIR